MLRSIQVILTVFLIELSRESVLAQPPALSPADFSAATNAGHQLAEQAHGLDFARYRGRKFTGKSGTLVAEGDSWFDYPNHDVLKMLRYEHDYIVESVAHRGDTLESMTYDRNQLAEVARVLQSLKDRDITPKAILISGGGNDIAGQELAVMLNHSRSGLEKLSPAISRELIRRRFPVAMVTLLTAITDLSKQLFDRPIPILIHGYDYPVPDGRGFLGGFWFLPGPWLKPSFSLKSDPLSPDSLKEDEDVMKSIIDDYNVMLESIPRLDNLSHVRYVKIVGTLSSDPGNYKSDWGNELHPTFEGFRRVADRFEEVLDTIGK